MGPLVDAIHGHQHGHLRIGGDVRSVRLGRVCRLGWVVVGLTLLAIARLDGLSPLARRRTATTAWLTMSNTVFLGLLGSLGIGLSIKWVSTARATDYWILASLFESVA